LVACLDERWSTIESCPYTGRESGVTKTLDRQQHQIKLRLVASRSGQTVAEELFTGTAPRACQDEESFSVNATSATVQGDPVALSAVQGWLKTFVAP
jgi:hypothetical protein